MDKKTDSAVTAAELDAMRVYAHEATKAITGLVGGGSECFGRELQGIFTADLPYCVKRIRDRIDASAERELNTRRENAALRQQLTDAQTDRDAQARYKWEAYDANKALTEQIAKKDAALRDILACTPHMVFGKDGPYVGFDCGNPFEIARNALAPAAHGESHAPKPRRTMLDGRTQPAPAPSAGDKRIAELEAALLLAANRLHRCVLDNEPGSLRWHEVSEWTAAARADLAAPAPAPSAGETQARVDSAKAQVEIEAQAKRIINLEAALADVRKLDNRAFENLQRESNAQAQLISELRPYRDELEKIADDLGDCTDPFAAWESIAALRQRIDAPAPAPSAGETRAAITDECATALLDMMYDNTVEDRWERGWNAALRSSIERIQALAAAPTTGEPT